ncbi:MAG: ABC-2 transporter permease [bacterium]|nr:ABC-2 transporter permease [bacterium]
MIFQTWSDLSLQHRSSLGLVPLAAVLMAVLALVMGVHEATAFPVVLVSMMAWGAGLRAAYEDDKADTWTFLRTLPVPPAQVVAARYLSGFLLTITFGLTIALPLILLGGGAWPAAGVGTGAGVALTGLFNAVYYRFGYRAVSTWFRYGLLLVALGGVLLARLILPGVDWPLLLGEVGTWLAANPALMPWLAGAGVLALYTTCWAYATWAFCRKELL